MEILESFLMGKRDSLFLSKGSLSPISIRQFPEAKRMTEKDVFYAATGRLLDILHQSESPSTVCFSNVLL